MIRVGAEEQSNPVEVRIAEASFPKPFAQKLEFNAPVHENWNIVHTGMLIPQVHQIYVGSQNCLRGVVLTADEMDAAHRISCVQVEERDCIGGKLEELTIKGVSDLISHLEVRPRAVELFLLCMHHLLGADERYIYEQLEKRFPDIDFMHCWMDPVMQKIALTPEQKQRKSMMGVIRALPKESRSVTLLGDNLRMPEEADLIAFLQALGCRVNQVQDALDYDAYLSYGDSAVYITRSLLSRYGQDALAKRDDRASLYLPPVLTEEEIHSSLRSLWQALAEQAGTPEAFGDVSVSEIDGWIDAFLQDRRQLAENTLSDTLELIGDTPVQLDYMGHQHPLGLARCLIEHGFHVTHVYLDARFREEEESFRWLCENAPELRLCSTNHVERRVLQRGGAQGEKILAIGPKAAYFANTPYFVNWIEGNGDWGYHQIVSLCEEMREAYQTKKDTHRIVPRKGLGCHCV